MTEKPSAGTVRILTRLLVVGMVALQGLVWQPSLSGATEPGSIAEFLDSPGYQPEHADVLRLYQAFFNRDPDLGGAQYWVERYEEGLNLDDLAWQFATSEEFRNTYGGALDNAAFLTIVYGNVLGRAPDQGGFNYWLGQMNQGLTQSGVVRWVVANDEFKSQYPFTAMGPDLSAALLQLNDLEPGWVQDTNETRPTGTDCGSSLQRRPSTLKNDFYKDWDSGPLIAHDLYAYPSMEGVDAYMAQIRRAVVDCASFVDTDGWNSTYQTLSYKTFGDETFAIKVTSSHNDGVDTWTWVSHFVVVRIGTVISIVQYIADSGVWVSQSEPLVELTTNRVVSVLNG